MDERTIEALRRSLGPASAASIEAIRAEVPAYAGALSGRMWDNIQLGVAVSLGSFLDIAANAPGAAASLAQALEGAYGLGRGEARSGRTVEALLAAFRVGSRASWGALASAAVEAGVDAAEIARLAGVVFEYVDELSAASAAGHAAELDAAGRLRRQRLGELGQLLVSGAPVEEVTAAAERAEWTPPRSLTAVLLPNAQAGALLGSVDDRALHLEGDVLTTLLVPEAGVRDRRRLARLVAGREAVVGPARPWTLVAQSVDRAQRMLELVRGGHVPAGDPTDTDDHLDALVRYADADALADLRARVLAPLEAVRPASRDRLVETLRSWLLHQGRRAEVAAELFVHEQTVRYRVGQLRDVFGDRLDDPATVRDLVIALG